MINSISLHRALVEALLAMPPDIPHSKLINYRPMVGLKSSAVLLETGFSLQLLHRVTHGAKLA